jgi:fatty acid desaturase
MLPPSDGPVTAGDLLTLEELGHLRRTSTLRGIVLVLHAWSVIAGAIALYMLWPSALTLGVAVLVIGARQLGLMVLMHETAHWLLFRQGRLNTWVGTWLCAAPLGRDLKAYRRRHHLHHRHTQTAEDPDLALSGPLPVSRGRLARALLRDLCGWTALARIAGGLAPRDGIAATWSRGRAPLVANAVLCAVLTAIGGWPLYLLAWVLPWATWFQLVTRVRDLAEHGVVPDAHDPLRNTRTIGAGFLARALVAPYGVNYHLEHHVFVFVPCWKLRQVRALLLARNLGGRMERAASYVEVLARVTTSKW